ncbi:chitin deacetylase [Microbulbifer sp. A4B17]|uniref:polysaccharide deacetylase family protein n=1 Tax=Microbulbifer sp. A4B17 TaxID=359370 RepID=UPI000D52A840|nr:polysaccharide deacetylase family protein [Microbulbifer sp. A4B17]AWF82064.1 chitin deacetylase [Microbulbifer sp. A4B17]
MHERNLQGYAGRPPNPHWPGQARIAVQFVLNLEEGSESTTLNGDTQSESYLHELPGRPARVGTRDFSVESMYEYGSRAGVWRLLDIFDIFNVPLTVFATGQALELNPVLARALVDAGHEVAGHGYRWIDYKDIPKGREKHDIQLTVKLIEQLTKRPPFGWYTGRVSPHTSSLVRKIEGLLYTSDSYCDDLPYWGQKNDPLLVIPYTLVNNDIQYLLPSGCTTADDFFCLLKCAFDQLWREGNACPKLMTIGLHGRVSGHPARAIGIYRFLKYIQGFEPIWICRRKEIAQHWISTFSNSS